MTWVAAAVVGSAAIGYVGSQQASRAQRSAANQASQVAAQTADAQTALQREQFNKQLELGAPFREAGLAGQNQLLRYLGLTAPTNMGTMVSTGQFGAGRPWNEAVYLSANPDVAAAVQRGEFGSGKEHYEIYGADEGRSLGYNPQYATKTEADRAAAEIVTQRAQPGFGKYATAEFGGVKGFDPASLMKGFTTQDFQADPGYAFRMSEGMKALERSAAARGGLLSGATLRGTQRFGQDLASQEYQNAFNRFQANRATQGQEYANAFNRFQAERANTLSPLQSLAGQGQAGAQQAAQASQAYTTGAGNALGAYGSAVQGNIIGSGNAQASGYMGGANALAGGLGQGINFYQNQQLMNRFFPSASTGPTLLAGG
jgi:hypothetical protein